MRSTLKFVAGAVLAGLLWWYGTPAYQAVLARTMTPVLQLDSRLRGTEAETTGRRIQIRSTRDLQFPSADMPADDYTYNVILLGGLIAMRRGSVRKTLLAVFALVVTHVLGLTASVEATYATRMNPWSDLHYSGGQQDFWIAVEYIYRLAGMFGIAFGLWLLTLPPGALSPRPSGPASASRRRRPE